MLEHLPRDLRVCSYVMFVSIQKELLRRFFSYLWASLRNPISPFPIHNSIEIL